MVQKRKLKPLLHSRFNTAFQMLADDDPSGAEIVAYHEKEMAEFVRRATLSVEAAAKDGLLSPEDARHRLEAYAAFTKVADLNDAYYALYQISGRPPPPDEPEEQNIPWMTFLSEFRRR